MKKIQYEGSERRTYFRILYRLENRPKLKIGRNEFEVADISEGGMRLARKKEVGLDQKVRGTATFLCGESIAVEGKIVWEKNGELGLLLEHLIPAAVMEKEKKHVILHRHQRADSP